MKGRKKYLAILFGFLFVFGCGGEKKGTGNNNGNNTVTNNPPIAEAGPDVYALPGEWVYLDGSGSSDPDGDQIYYSWAVVESPEGSRFLHFDRNSAVSAFMAEDVGNYKVELVVYDGKDYSSPDTTYVRVVTSELLAPVAHALSSSGKIGGYGVLDGFSSIDPRGRALSYSWSLTGVSPSTCDTSTFNFLPLELPSFSFPISCPGGTKYYFSLTVSNGEYQSSPSTAVVEVENSPPELRSLQEPSWPHSTQTSLPFDFTATPSDNDGDSVTCHFEVVQNSSGVSITPRSLDSCTPEFIMTPNQPDVLSYEVFLIELKDGKGGKYRTYVTGYGEDQNGDTPIPPPSLNVTYSQPEFSKIGSGKFQYAITEVTGTLDIDLSWNGNKSYINYSVSITNPPEGITYVVENGSGPWPFTGTNPLPVTAKVYVFGKYRPVKDELIPITVRFEAWSNQQDYPFHRVKDKKFSINLKNNPPVVENMSPVFLNSPSTEPYACTFIDGSAFDPDGDALIYRWAVVAKPEGSRFSLSTNYAQDDVYFCAGAFGDKYGTYTLRLYVRDEKGLWSSRDVEVVVSE